MGEMRLSGVLVEERLLQLGLGLGLVLGLDDNLQALAPFLDRLQRPLEHDLEGGELLVDVVFGLVPELAGGGLGVVDDGLRDAAGLAHHLGALHHALGADPPRLDDVVGLTASLAEELLALLEQPPRMPQLLGERRDRLLEQLEELLPVDEHRRRHGHRPARLDQLLEAQQDALDVVRGLVAHEPSPEAFVPNRSARRLATAGGTMLATSPPNWAISRTRLDDKKEYWGLVEMKNVSMPESRWFICAIWSS